LAEHLQGHGLQGAAPPPTPAPQAEHRRLAERQVAALLRLEITLIAAHALPPYLAAVRPLPVALFVRGRAELLFTRPATAIVGARRAGTQGVRWAEALSLERARAGELIVSGGALGVDTAAHRGALAAGGPTVVYMGTAIDRAYPRHNLPLFADIVQHGGALVSEHPPYAATFKSHHALRNRLIAAHGDRLIVVEAALNSGTLGAVQFARRLARPVFVAPAEAGGERQGLEAIVERGWGHVWPGV
jgi:DNA processing protein